VISGGGDGEDAEIAMFAVKRDPVRRAIRPLAAAGVEVDVVQMAPLALYNSITFDRIGGARSKDSVVVIDVGADNTDLVITDGVRIWQRNVPIGGNHFTRAPTMRLRLTFAEAELLKRTATEAPDPGSVFRALREVFDDFARGVNRSIGFFKSSNKGAKITKLIGLGNGFKLPGLLDNRRQDRGYEVERLVKFERLVGGEVTGTPRFGENLSSFAVAYGLELQCLGEAVLGTNLLPPEWRAIRGWSPGAVVARARRVLIRKTPGPRDDAEASRDPVARRPPPEPPACPACLADWPGPGLDVCKTCGWQRHPGANPKKWGRVGGCPRCGFSYRWDGRKCSHCRPGRAGPDGRNPPGPAGGF